MQQLVPRELHNDTATALEEAGKQLAKDQPELATLLIAAQMGYSELTITETDEHGKPCTTTDRMSFGRTRQKLFTAKDTTTKVKRFKLT